MVSLTRPSDEAIREFLASQGDLALTYPNVGATATTPPPGYVVDHTRALLGHGEETFARARNALIRWRQLRLGWVEARPPGAAIRTGELVAIVACRFGIWWLSACRIVRVVDDPGPVRRFGFAYGTLPDHAGSGEERFLIEWDEASGEVWYDILAFSRPNWILTRIFRGDMRRLQRRFGKESVAAMERALEDDLITFSKTNHDHTT
jgi:uncharacterized protein (UPF0548 family)